MPGVENTKPGVRLVRVSASMSGRRLDQALAEALPEFSRSRLQQWIDDGWVLVDGGTRRRRDKVRVGEEIRLTTVAIARNECLAQAIPLDVLFEDEYLLVVNKPAGLVVHPAAGNPDGTLQNALLYRVPALDQIPRAGIVHRLDKDTTGLLVVAKTLQAHKSLVEQLQRRTVSREYRALVQGGVVAGGIVEAPIGRHPIHRTRMAVVSNGRSAVTHYRVLERFAGHTLLAVHLETGRTHQIRVHLAHIHHPLVGDRTYGARPRPPRGVNPSLAAALQCFPRQALHAIALGLDHPKTGKPMRWEIPMAEDVRELLDLLRGHHEPD